MTKRWFINFCNQNHLLLHYYTFYSFLTVSLIPRLVFKVHNVHHAMLINNTPMRRPRYFMNIMVGYAVCSKLRDDLSESFVHGSM